MRKNYNKLMEGDDTWKIINTDGLTLDQVDFEFKKWDGVRSYSAL